MTTLSALSTGFRSANKSFRMIVLLYAFNFVIAAILAWGVHSVLSTSMGDSMSLEKLVKDFDYSVYADFGLKNTGKISAITSEITVLIVFYLLLYTLLGGGTIATLQNIEDRFSLRSFFENCGSYFLRFFRLLLIFGIILFLDVFVMMAVLGVLHSALTDSATSEVMPIVLGIVCFALFLFSVMIVVLMADYAKVATVRNNATSMLKITWQAISFVFRHFFATVAVQLSILVVLLIGVGVYLFLDSQIGMSSVATVLVMFVFQQGSVLFKVWTRVLTYGAEIDLYERLQVQKPLAELEAALAPASEITLKPAETPLALVPAKRKPRKRTVSLPATQKAVSRRKRAIRKSK